MYRVAGRGSELSALKHISYSRPLLNFLLAFGMPCYSARASISLLIKRLSGRAPRQTFKSFKVSVSYHVPVLGGRELPCTSLGCLGWRAQ